MMSHSENFLRNRARARGMTLMEVVVAIGVAAFAVPLILAAVSSAGFSRRNAEADTRSVWIARQVQQEVLAAWAEPPRKSVISTSFPYPEGAARPPAKVLFYDRDGTFLAEGAPADLGSTITTPKAVYLVRIAAEKHVPPNFAASPTSSGLALLSLEVLYPASASPDKRSRYSFRVITTRHGSL